MEKFLHALVRHGIAALVVAAGTYVGFTIYQKVQASGSSADVSG